MTFGLLIPRSTLTFGFLILFSVHLRQPMGTRLLLSEPDRLRLIRKTPEVQRDLKAFIDVHSPRARRMEVLLYDWGYIMDVEYREPMPPKGSSL